MNRQRDALEELEKRIPHACGDEPHMANPRKAQHHVFPTHVGMNRARRVMALHGHSIPHACGDEPATVTVSGSSLVYSPRMWG